METIKEEKKSEWDLVCMLPTYLPTKEINGKFYVEASDLTNYANETNEEIGRLQDEIWKLRLHIEAKDEAYMKLLKDYEKLKESSETKEETLIKAIGDIFNKLTQ